MSDETTVSTMTIEGLATGKAARTLWMNIADEQVTYISERLTEAGLGKDDADGRFADDPDFLTVEADELRKMLLTSMSALAQVLNLAVAARMIMAADNMLVDAIDAELADPRVTKILNEASRDEASNGS